MSGHIYPAIAAMAHAERMARHQEKRRRVLAFLRQELWTTPAVLAALLGTPERPAQRQAVHRLVAGLVRDGLATTELLPTGQQVIGITPTGQAEAAALVGKAPIPRAYERGRIPAATLAHRIDAQALRVACAKAGWSGWVYPDRLPVAEKARWGHRPDAVATTPGGLRVAVECERTVKTAKRYRFVIGRHLAQIAAGMYAHVIYACPTPALAAAVAAVVHGLGHVVVDGVDKLLGEGELARFDFLTYDEVPSWTGKEP
ncbi:MAG: hypothetical protein DI596_14865 [Azospira oryzae]|nr:MAG: hypothetical protein DI596_14865 [Azospira oryzae]PZP75328.1 MAG: hypothetical protein DI593_14865 [Azospira oryzae]